MILGRGNREAAWRSLEARAAGAAGPPERSHWLDGTPTAKIAAVAWILAVEAQDAALLPLIERLVAKRPTYGYRRSCQWLRHWSEKPLATRC